MPNVPDDERILEILRRGGYDISEDWAWIRHYLELADKCLNPGDAPREDAPLQNSNAPGPAAPAEPAKPIDIADAQAAKPESNPPKVRGQSA
jgi:hypothetical protein